MARRKVRSQSGPNPILQAYFQDRLLRRRQQEAEAMQRETQAAYAKEIGLRGQAGQALEDIRAGRLSPDVVPEGLKAYMTEGYESLRPSEEQLLEPLYGSIASASNEFEVPSQDRMIAGLKARGIATDTPYTQGDQLNNITEEIPLYDVKGGGPSAALSGLTSAAGQRTGALRAATGYYQPGMTLSADEARMVPPQLLEDASGGSFTYRGTPTQARQNELIQRITSGVPTQKPVFDDAAAPPELQGTGTPTSFEPGDNRPLTLAERRNTALEAAQLGINLPGFVTEEEQLMPVQTVDKDGKPVVRLVSRSSASAGQEFPMFKEPERGMVVTGYNAAGQETTQLINPTDGHTIRNLGTKPRTDNLPITIDDPLYADAIQRAVLYIPANRRDTMIAFANDLWKRGDKEQLGQVIRQMAVETEDVNTQREIRGRMQTRDSMLAIAEDLDALEASGVDTNIVRGKAEQLVRYLGATSNPELVRIGQRIQANLITFRRAATGVTSSYNEPEAYNALWPDIRSVNSVNMNLIYGLLDEMDVNDSTYWNYKLGPNGAALVLGAGTPTSTAIAPLSDGAEFVRDPTTGRVVPRSTIAAPNPPIRPIPSH